MESAERMLDEIAVEMHLRESYMELSTTLKAWLVRYDARKAKQTAMEEKRRKEAEGWDNYRRTLWEADKKARNENSS